MTMIDILVLLHGGNWVDHVIHKSKKRPEKREEMLIVNSNRHVCLLK